MAISQADLASGLAEIHNLSIDELKELCNTSSNEKYDDIVNKSDRVSEFHWLCTTCNAAHEENSASQEFIPILASVFFKNLALTSRFLIHKPNISLTKS